MQQSDTHNGQIRMYGNFRRFEPGDSNRTLYDIVSDLEARVIQVPTFQRDFVWNDSKRIAFINRLIEGRKPIGVISTYEIEGDDQWTVYLNDGLQRLSTCVELLNNSSKYGLAGKEDAIDLLKSYAFSVQHRRYISHDEALQDYKDINQGTALTAFEFYKGDITNIPSYDLFWKSRIERLHSVVSAAVQRSGTTISDRRKNYHKYLRHDYALFIRFADEEKANADYDISESTNRGGRKSIEQRFREYLDTVSPDEFDAKLKQLTGMLDATTADVIDAWGRIGENGLSVQAGLLRWLFDVAIWRRNNGVPVDIWRDFIIKLLTATNGGMRLIAATRTNLIRLSELSRLRGACEAVGSSMYEYEPPKRRQRRPANAMKGYDMSHIVPFSLVGDGPTIMEPSSINRARGNRSSVIIAPE